jgi:glycosyltransferase involved in cell wall biosynthesis
MRVLYDDQAFQWFGWTSISRYFCELMRFSASMRKIDVLLTVERTENVALNGSEALSSCRYSRKSNRCPWAMARAASSWMAPFCGGAGRLLNRVQSICALRGRCCDVIHPTYYNPYFLRHRQGKPFVLTVFDCIHELLPELFVRDPAYFWKMAVMTRAAQIIAASETTKRDILNCYDIDPDRVTVIYPGASIGPCAKSDSVVLPAVFLLYVGHRSLHKNFYLFIKAFGKVARNMPALQLLCAGGAPFSPYESAIFRHLGIGAQVIQAELTDSELALAYSKATGLVVPSLYEGFGMTVLEAFQRGCPVVCSRGGALPEVAGEAALFFDPRSVEDMTQALHKLVCDPGLRAVLKEAGSKRAMAFSWEKCAEQTLGVYEKCLGSLRVP